MPASYYDNVQVTEYWYDDLAFGWRSMYAHALAFIMGCGKDVRVFDLGCGSGRFAQFCKIFGIKNYMGVDFSERCIEIARERNPDYDFKVANLDHPATYTLCEGYDVFVCLEVLEHVENDQYIVASLPSGRGVFISVPNTWDKAHVRVFSTQKDAIDRYSDLLDIRFTGTQRVSEYKNFQMLGGFRL